MLPGKMGRSLKRDDAGSDSHFHCCSVPGLFLGSSPKVLSDSDSIKSPTSPLDHVFPNLDHTLNRKSWDCGKVGLGIVDFLKEEEEEEEDTKDSDKIIQSILFGPQIRTMAHISRKPISSFQPPNSLPKNYPIFSQTRLKSPLQQANSDVFFEIGEAAFEPDPFRKFRACSLDSSISFSAPNATTLVISSPRFIGIGGSSNSNNSTGCESIQLSEDYTCVISHGPNPKTTHIYSDCILECHSTDLKEIAPPISAAAASEFLSFCYCCSKSLEEGKDIYIYRSAMNEPCASSFSFSEEFVSCRGEKAFCSLDCRSREIMIDEELEKSENRSFQSDNSEELFEV